METFLPSSIHDLPKLRERLHVFQNRTRAGEILGDMLAPHIQKSGYVMAIPAGGVPVGIVVSERLDLPIDLAVVSKITLPWNTEAGYGAVAFDGTFRLNRSLLLTIGSLRCRSARRLDLISKLWYRRTRQERIRNNGSIKHVKIT